MSLFVLREETVSGIGEKIIRERINWKPIILIVIALLAISGVAGYLISRAGNGETAGNLPVIAPPGIKPPVPQTTPQNNPEGRIWTVEELVLEFVANPDKYKRGTVFQVSGVYHFVPQTYYEVVNFSLGPPVTVYDPVGRENIEMWVTIVLGIKEEGEVLKAWSALKEGDRVTISGEFRYFFSTGEDGVSFENAVIVSVTPAK